MELFYPNISWNHIQKISFRFVSLFVLLFIFPFPLDLVSIFIPSLNQKIFELQDGLIPFFGNTFLGIKEQISLEENGSGDKLKDYVKLFMFTMLAMILALIWSLADRKRKNYDTIFHYFLIICRYYLAFTLLGYGFQKVYKLQMGEVGLGQLLTPFGEQSPMGLAWKFVGFSDLYCKFSGWAEVIPGLLLFFRRTTLIGAIISSVVMFNVMMMNYAYDIPVKIYSTFLVFMGLIILSPYCKQLINFLILKKITEQTDSTKKLFYTKWKKITAIILKVIIILYAVIGTIIQCEESKYQYGENAPKPPMYGFYKTKLYVRNNDTLPLFTDSTAIKRLLFVWPESISIHKFNDSKKAYKAQIDTIKKKIIVTDYNDSSFVFNLNYKKLNDSIFEFNTIIQKDTIYIKTQRYDRNSFNLYKIGFNWVNEYPNNR